MSLPDSPSQNHLLAALARGGIRASRPASGTGPAAARRNALRTRRAVAARLFPTTAIVSLLYVLESGASAEIAGVGNEGVLGISLFMGGDTTPSSAVVQTAGHGYRLRGKAAEGGIQSRRLDAASAAPLYPGAAHADVPDRGLQSAPFDRAATVPMAVADPRSIAFERAGHDAGIGRQRARRAPGKHHGGRRKFAARRHSSVTAAATSPCSSGPAWRPAPASATPSSRRNWHACCPMCAYRQDALGHRRLTRCSPAARVCKRGNARIASVALTVPSAGKSFHRPYGRLRAIPRAAPVRIIGRTS
mgnify:CR=1 FL=1